MLDFAPLRRQEKTYADLAAGLTRRDLATLTREMVGRQLQLLEDVADPDVTLEPDDPAAKDTFAARPEDVSLAWTLGHVIVHATASSEEAAAQALTLARGLEVDGRSRIEVPWQDATTVAFLRTRLAESLRMRLAMLEAWPDRPDLEVTYAYQPSRPPFNAMTRFLSGLSHDDSHLAQIREIVRQARAGRSAA